MPPSYWKKYCLPRYGNGQHNPKRRQRRRGSQLSPEFVRARDWLRRLRCDHADALPERNEKVSLAVKERNGRCYYKILGEDSAYQGCGHGGKVTPYCSIVVDVYNRRYRCFKFRTWHDGHSAACTPQNDTSGQDKPAWVSLTPHQQEQLDALMPAMLKLVNQDPTVSAPPPSSSRSARRSSDSCTRRSHT